MAARLTCRWVNGWPRAKATNSGHTRSGIRPTGFGRGVQLPAISTNEPEAFALIIA